MTLSDKDFFKKMKQEFKDYSEEIEEGFPYFCLKIFRDSLSQDDIQEALVGLKTNDESIDAFFIDEENREINILQCKSARSKETMTVLKKEWLSYFNEVTQKLRNHEYIDQHKNPKLKEIAEQFLIYEKKGFKTKLHFFHLGWGRNESVLEYYKDIIYYDWEKIKKAYNDIKSKFENPPSINIDLPSGLGIIKEQLNNKNQTFISIITGDELVKLRETYRYKLFDKNLRFGLGKNKINKEIMKTCSGAPDNFYFFNNGLTITSKGFKYQRTNGKLKIECPQIINGAQTVNSIYEAYKEKKNKLSREKKEDAKQETKKEFKRIKVLFRIIQDSSKDGKKTSDFEKNIIKYNNSQNIIKETDFYANNKEQIKLQESFAKFGFFYEIKRGDRKYLQEKSKNEHNLLKKTRNDFTYWEEKIDIEKLASLWMAYSLDPKLDKIKKNHIFGSNPTYNTVFDEGEISDERTQEMILAYYLYEIIYKELTIFGTSTKNGQLINKLHHIESDKDSYPNLKEGLFINIKTIVENSLIFNKMIKQDFESKETFLENKEFVTQEICSYSFFDKPYLTLAIFKLILDKCNYLEIFFKNELFLKKDFIKGKVVSKWLPIILDKLIKKEYEEFQKKSPKILATMTFYNKTETFDNIKTRFNRLKYEENQDFKDIFPLNL